MLLQERILALETCYLGLLLTPKTHLIVKPHGRQNALSLIPRLCMYTCMMTLNIVYKYVHLEPTDLSPPEPNGTDTSVDHQNLVWFGRFKLTTLMRLVVIALCKITEA